MTNPEHAKTEPTTHAKLESIESEMGSSDSFLNRIVEKITHEPFLFVLGISAILVGLVIQGTELASSDLRFIVMIIALLGFVVILGNYALSVTGHGNEDRTPKKPQGTEDRTRPSTVQVQRGSEVQQGTPELHRNRVAQHGKYSVYLEHGENLDIGDKMTSAKSDDTHEGESGEASTRR